ncbi:MAG TPA: GDSL-type esterase/lipase family protein [Amycolatopsis sp.]|nr:GDSL-type esterase/lipase family protein [Amycolatopsis sp.]
MPAPPPDWHHDRVAQDLRVCFVGDSFVAGVGDPGHQGWVGRIAARTEHTGRPLTTYNLGVRRDTSANVLARWHVECAPRLPAGCAAMIVLSFGVNDTMLEDGRPRVAPTVPSRTSPTCWQGYPAKAGRHWSSAPRRSRTSRTTTGSRR